MMNILKIKDLVYQVLEENPIARDNDNILVAMVWYMQLNNMGYQGSRDFMTILGVDELSKYESISRCARKIKEDNPSLRGGNYILRQQEQTSVVRQIKGF